MTDFDVLVVGGGPAGAVTARIAANSGARVLLVEKRSTLEEPAACAGLVSPRTLPVLGASSACVLRGHRRVSFHAPGGPTLSFCATTDRAVVVDRSRLETELLALAGDAGVVVRLGAAAASWQGGVLRFTTALGEEAATGRVLVGADGPDSAVAAWAGLGPRLRPLRAAQAEVVAPESGEIDVFVGRDVAPGFFAWSIPAQRDRLRVGVAVPAPADPALYLDRLLAARFAGCAIASRVEAPIPAPDPERAIARDDVLLVGDAAGHVKPLSGGGLYFGGLCARLAGRAAASAARAPETRAASLREYEEGCRTLLGPETRFGERAAGLRDALEDADWDSVFTLLNRPEFVALVERHVDLDHLRFLAPRLVGHPRLWRTLFDAWSVVRASAAAHGFADPGDTLL